MWFLALELWPYVLAALMIGLLTGWFSNRGFLRKAVLREDHQLDCPATVQEETR